MSNNTLRDRLKDKTADAGGDKFPKFLTSIIKFNGNTGKFSFGKLVGDTVEEPTEITNPTIQVLKRRSVLFSPMATGSELFTSEFSSPQDEVSLFDATAGVTFVESDSVQNLRDKYPQLKTRCILYCLYNGEIVKFEVKGASLSAFFELQKKLQEDDKHLFEVTIPLTTQKSKNEKTKSTYYSVVFGVPALLEDFAGVEEAIDTVNAAITLQVKYQQSKQNTPRAAVVKTEAEQNAAASVASFDSEAEVDDIPF